MRRSVGFGENESLFVRVAAPCFKHKISKRDQPVRRFGTDAERKAVLYNTGFYIFKAGNSIGGISIPALPSQKV